MEERKPSWLKKKPESTTDWMLIIFAGIAFYMVLNNAGYVLGLLENFMAILTPFAAGIVIAYIINPVVVWSHKHICRSHPKLHWLSMLIGYIVAIVVVVLMMYLITTQVITAITAFSANLSGYQANLVRMLEELGQWEHWPDSWDLAAASEYVGDLSNIAKTLIGWLTDQVNKLDKIFGDVKDTFVLTFTAIASSVYLLSQKEKLLRHARILTHAFLPRKVARNVLRICHQANRNLSGFFSGKIIDSAIIGVLTYVCMLIFGMEFAPVISIIVGVTNIIPVFGPFIGAIPGILLLLFIEPMQALGFAVLILVIQQLDGNVIGPTILGDSIGVDALWVLVSIVVGGELLGLPGMVIGVPAFATVMSVVKELAEWCLRRRGITKEGELVSEKKADDGTPEDGKNGAENSGEQKDGGEKSGEQKDGAENSGEAETDKPDEPDTEDKPQEKSSLLHRLPIKRRNRIRS